jgi:hypothetical protein
MFRETTVRREIVRRLTALLDNMEILGPLTFVVVFSAIFLLLAEAHVVLRVTWCLFYQLLFYPSWLSDHPMYQKLLLGTVLAYDLVLIVLFGTVGAKRSRALRVKGVQILLLFVAPWILVVLVRCYCRSFVSGFG